MTVEAGGTTADFEPRRDWAAADTGGQIADFNGPDFTASACGPAVCYRPQPGHRVGQHHRRRHRHADQRDDPEVHRHRASGDDRRHRRLPSTRRTCAATRAAPRPATTGSRRRPTAPTGTSADEGTFDATNRYIYNEITPGAPIEDVSFVRFTMLSPQVPDFATNCPDGAVRWLHVHRHDGDRGVRRRRFRSTRQVASRRFATPGPVALHHDAVHAEPRRTRSCTPRTSRPRSSKLGTSTTPLPRRTRSTRCSRSRPTPAPTPLRCSRRWRARTACAAISTAAHDALDTAAGVVETLDAGPRARPRRGPDRDRARACGQLLRRSRRRAPLLRGRVQARHARRDRRTGRRRAAHAGDLRVADRRRG